MTRQCGGLRGFEGLQRISKNIQMINGCKNLRAEGFWMGPAGSGRLIGYPSYYKVYLNRSETR